MKKMMKGQTFLFRGLLTAETPVKETETPKKKEKAETADIKKDVAKKAEKKEKKTAPKKPAAKKTPEKTKGHALKKFYDEYNNKVLDPIVDNEDGYSPSEEFKDFCKKLSSALKKEAKEKGFDSVSVKSGYKSVSGFFKKAASFVYWSFSIALYGEPTSLDSRDCSTGFLYRTAKSEKDFSGGENHYTDLLGLVDGVAALMPKEDPAPEKQDDDSYPEISKTTSEELRGIFEEKLGVTFSTTDDGMYFAKAKKIRMEFYLHEREGEKKLHVGWSTSTTKTGFLGKGNDVSSVEEAVSFFKDAIEEAGKAK